MAPAVVKMVAMPDAFEDSSKPSTTAPRSPANLLFPRAEPYRPPKAAQDAHINLLTYTREPPTRPFMSTGLAPTELDRHIRNDEAADAHGERLLRLAIELGGQRLPELDGPRVSVEALLVGRGAGLRLLPVQELVLEAHAVARKPRAKPSVSHTPGALREAANHKRPRMAGSFS